jgi:hypothetical protein
MKKIILLLLLTQTPFLTFLAQNKSTVVSSTYTTVDSKQSPSKFVPYRDPKSGLYGYKNETGKLVIPCKFAFVSEFSDGLAAVNQGGKVGFDSKYNNEYFVNGGKWGYIDLSGKLVIPCKFDEADSFYDGYAIVGKGGKKTFIDKSGKELTPYMYEMMNPFSEGLAVVAKGDPLVFSYIDKTGKEVIAGDYSAAANFFKGKARVTRYGAVYYINTKGERLK